ncbi:aminoglycoside phosphotransferase family protein [Nocardia sp. BMG111209]|uniref:aminoglycoside phosphotransferase family protein n=1 Tax=Nocardia sp. BMG111209 TaxID=1160137 RepID=UPI0007C46189|nr:aminoglycoside phosphotransferase family protein [Nocardia sp. BMG111209]
MAADSTLPGFAELETACRAYGLSAVGAQLLHRRSNAVWLVGDTVARLAPDTALRRIRASTGVAVSRWLTAVTAEPIALDPLPGEQPVLTGAAVATFWPYRPTTERPTIAAVADLVRRLHAQPLPPFEIPTYRPLRRLQDALDVDDARAEPALTVEERDWLLVRARELIAAFDATEFPLGRGLVHADAHDENVIIHDGRWVLIDWDNACFGPRELDLVGTLPDHFHTSRSERAEFVGAYGYDLLEWADWPLLRDITEYHSLGSYIRLAPSVPQAARELRRRVESLRSGDRRVVWRTLSR